MSRTAARRRCTLAFYNNATVNGIVLSQRARIIGSLAPRSNTGDGSTDKRIELEWARRLDECLQETFECAATHYLSDGGCVPNPIGRFADPLEIEIIPYRFERRPAFPQG